MSAEPKNITTEYQSSSVDSVEFRHSTISKLKVKVTCNMNKTITCIGEHRNLSEPLQEVHTFTDVECHQPVVAGWTSWEEWGPCTETCGGGKQTRIRRCSPKRNLCDGFSEDRKECKETECPLDGGWTSWESWGACSKSCGDGTKARIRTCTNLKPQHNGKPCNGVSEDRKECKETECPMDGGWTSWGSWGACSKSCGDGTKARIRTCTNPKPQHNGKTCNGGNKNSQECNETECPIDGGWTTWGKWGTCSKSCGGGSKVRTRSCRNPPPAHGGAHCTGLDTGITTCNLQICCNIPNWSSWEAWGSCSETCGLGRQTRQRNCNNPAPNCAEDKCIGSNNENKECNLQICCNNPNWSGWGAWGTCSKTCGNGQQTRQRKCNNPAPNCAGKVCTGSNSESAVCRIKFCPPTTPPPCRDSICP